MKQGEQQVKAEGDIVNEYMKQAFALCDVQNATVETVIQTFDDGAAFCRLWMESGNIAFPLNAVINNFAESDRGAGDIIAFKLALFCKSSGEIFEDKEEYSKVYHGRFASESVVPYGTMLKDGKQDCTVRVHGKIVSARKVDIAEVPSLHIRIACQGYVFDTFFDENILPFVGAGNIICCIYDAIGINML